MTTQTEALKRIAAYPFSRAEELSVAQMREIAREALMSLQDGAQPSQDSVAMADYMALVEKYAFLKASQRKQLTDDEALKLALNRIGNYIEKRKSARGIDIESIHAFDLSVDGGFELCLSDLELLKEALAQPEQEHEVLGFNGWGFPIEKPNKALIEKTADHDVDCLCIDCSMVDEQDDVPWTDKAFERLCENWNNMTSAEFAIVQRFLFGVYAHPPVPTAQPKEPEQEPVAWMIVNKSTNERFLSTQPNNWDDMGWFRHPLYTTPPQRKPLTDEQIDEAWSSATGGSIVTDDMRAFARTIYSIKE